MVWLPETPAFLGLRPPELIWQPLELSKLTKNHQAWWFLTQKQSALLNHPHLKLTRLQTHHELPFGFYRLQTPEQDVFLKLVSDNGIERQQAAQEVADYLRQHQVETPALLAGFPLQLTESVWALAYPFVDGRFSDYGLEDLQAIGRAVGLMHRVLKAYPQREKVETQAIVRKQMLQTRWESVLAAPVCLSQLPPEVQRILQSHSPDWFWHLMENGQMVHGDLNVGNVKILPDGQVMLLDWEDSLTAWFDPLKDLAFIIERFVLTVHDQHRLCEHAQALLDSYFSENPVQICSENRFVDLIQALAIRALLILTEGFFREQQAVPDSEWQKFCFLYKLSNDFAGELRQMTHPYLSS